MRRALTSTLSLATLVALLAASACGSTGSTRASEDQAAKAGDARVQHVLDALGLNYEVDGDGDFKLGFGLDGGRSQIVFIGSGTDQLGELEIRNVWSYVYSYRGQLTQEAAAWLLARNDQVKLGSYGIVTMPGGDRAVIFLAKIAAGGSLDEIRASLMAVSETADEAEERFTGSSDAF